VGVALIHANRRTDREMDMAKVISTFRDYTNAILTPAKKEK